MSFIDLRHTTQASIPLLDDCPCFPAFRNGVPTQGKRSMRSLKFNLAPIQGHMSIPQDPEIIIGWTSSVVFALTSKPLKTLRASRTGATPDTTSAGRFSQLSPVESGGAQKNSTSNVLRYPFLRRGESGTQNQGPRHCAQRCDPRSRRRRTFSHRDQWSRPAPVTHRDRRWSPQCRREPRLQFFSG